MKNSRKISLLLVLAMILTSLVLPMSASAAEVATLLEDNFNSYETVDALKAKWGVDTNSSTTITPASIALGTGADNSAALQLNRTTGTDWIMKHFTTIIADEGSLKATLKIKNDYDVVDGGTQYFDTFIAFGSKNNNSKFLPALYINGGVLYTGQNSAKYGTKVCEMANGEWYDIEFTYDVATKDFAITVSKAGEECGTASLVPPQGVGSMTAVETMRIQMWGTENAGSLTIDDVNIVKVASYIEDNFNGYTDVDALKAKWGVDTNSSTTITPASIALGTGADNSAALQLNRTTGTDWIMKHFATGVGEDGALKATLKIKNDYNVVDGGTQYFDTFIAFGSKNNNSKFLPALYINGGVLYTGQNSAKYGTKVCEMANGEWYDIEFTYDVETKDFAITVSKDGEECGTASLVPPQGVGSMTAVETMRIQMWGTENAGSLTIDDIVIDDYVAPEVEEPTTIEAQNIGAFEGTDGSVATAFKAEMTDVTGKLSLTVTPSEGEAKDFDLATTFTEANVVFGLIVNNLYDAEATAVVTVVE